MHMIISVNSESFLNSFKNSIFVMEVHCVFLAVRTEFLNII
jgi:hypothetical protein